MGLDFTKITDNAGAALHVLYGGGQQDTQTFTRLKESIEQQSGHQVVLLDINTPDGEKVRDFYDILPEQMPAAFIVRDDDSLVQLWTGMDIPSYENEIVYQLKQTSEV